MTEQTQTHTKSEVPTASSGASSISVHSVTEHETNISQTKEKEPELSKFKVLCILIMTGFLMLLVALDKTIIGVALPAISNEFHSLDQVGWYGSAYMATNAALQLLWGRIYQRNPVKPIFTAAVIIFEAGSALCGAAPNSTALIVGRAIAGAGGAGITNGLISIIMAVVPLEKRPMAQASLGAVFGLAAAVGPLLGGAFTERVTWRWCFYINLPFAMVAMLPVFFFLDAKKTADKGKKMLPFNEQFRRIDPVGTVLILASVVCLILALQWGGQASSPNTTNSWSSHRVIALFVVFAITLVAFIAWQVYKGDSALLPPKIFIERSVLGSFWYVAFFQASTTVMFYYIPFWFQVVKGFSPIESSYRTLATIACFVVSTIAGGIITRKVGYYAPLLLIPPVVGSIGAGLITTWSSTTSTAEWAGYQVLYGLGMGFGQMGTSLAVQAALPHSDVPLAIGALFFAREMGSAIFVSTGESLLSSRLLKGLEQIPELKGRAAQLAVAGASEIRKAVQGSGEQVLDEVIYIFNAALRNVWYLAFALAITPIVPFFLIKWLNLQKVTKQCAAEAEAAKKTKKTTEEA